MSTLLLLESLSRPPIPIWWPQWILSSSIFIVMCITTTSEWYEYVETCNCNVCTSLRIRKMFHPGKQSILKKKELSHGWIITYVRGSRNYYVSIIVFCMIRYIFLILSNVSYALFTLDVMEFAPVKFSKTCFAFVMHTHFAFIWKNLGNPRCSIYSTWLSETVVDHLLECRVPD